MDPSPDEEDVLGFYRFIGKAFIDAPMVACPHLDRKEFEWRSPCVYGAMMYARGLQDLLQVTLSILNRNARTPQLWKQDVEHCNRSSFFRLRGLTAPIY